MSTCNRLYLQTPGSQPVIMPENLLGHWLCFVHNVLMNGEGLKTRHHTCRDPEYAVTLSLTFRLRIQTDTK